MSNFPLLLLITTFYK